ncbi:unnamed protein product [Periconia digitata]|uniref:Uncharacterized protein n=1 Tax=Periconia digitata TaxID=1303443 RepID=A0A9W4UC19_9PLEO|nr:unnamed protein product [Periconia digitata]
MLHLPVVWPGVTPLGVSANGANIFYRHAFPSHLASSLQRLHFSVFTASSVFIKRLHRIKRLHQASSSSVFLERLPRASSSSISTASSVFLKPSSSSVFIKHLHRIKRLPQASSIKRLPQASSIKLLYFSVISPASSFPRHHQASFEQYLGFLSPHTCI